MTEPRSAFSTGTASESCTAVAPTRACASLMRLTSDSRIHTAQVDDPVVRAMARLMSSTSPEEIEAVADYLGASADSRAIGPLASRPADNRVHDDPHPENCAWSSPLSPGD